MMSRSAVYESCNSRVQPAIIQWVGREYSWTFATLSISFFPVRRRQMYLKSAIILAAFALSWWLLVFVAWTLIQGLALVRESRQVSRIPGDQHAGIDGDAHRAWPLTRFLYVCVNKPPRQPLSAPGAEFLRFLLSREGQHIVADGGNIQLGAATVAQGRRAME